MSDFLKQRAALGTMKIMACVMVSLATAMPKVLAAEESSAMAKSTFESRAFSTVPAGDALYENLAAVERAGWIQGNGTTALRSQLTRYEIAVETAKVVFYTSARHETDARWLAEAPRGSLRALRDLCKALSDELSGMGVDVRATLKMTEKALRSDFGKLSQDTKKQNPRETAASLDLAAPGIATGETPLGAAMVRAATNPARVAQAQRMAASTRAFSGVESGTNLRLGLAPWLSLRAGYGSRDLTTPLAANDLPVTGAQRAEIIGGGVDVALAGSLALSGRVENIEAIAAGNPSWLRYSTQIGVKTLDNRFALSANLARLIPQNAAGGAATSAGVNLDLGVSERLKFKLLYQQLFGTTTVPTGNVRVAGGVSLNF